MNCANCQQLASRLARIERIHADRLRNLVNNGDIAASQDEYNRLRIAESDAKLEMANTQRDLSRHKLSHDGSR
jgi:hypothetical protein